MATEQQKSTTSGSKTPAAKGPDAGTGVVEEAKASHERRTTVLGADNVDARLDNRTGAKRPPLETFPAKPQQVDGPDVQHQVEHTRATLELDPLGRKPGKDGERKGMFSPGPHGLSGEDLREDDQVRFGTEGLTEAEAAKGSPKAN
jgi:hypothetical protein